MNITMKMTFYFLLLFLIGCGEMMEQPEEVKPILDIANSASFEGTASPKFIFEVSLSEALEEDIKVPFTTEGLTAEPGVDFENLENGEITISAGSLRGSVEIGIIDDEIKEVDEKMQIKLLPLATVEYKRDFAVGLIRDDDEAIAIEDTGYTTERSHYGYELVWEEDFDSGELDLESFNYEYGDNGWGNNELQNYTDAPENVFIDNSSLVIKAIDNGGKFTSARLQTKDKKEFKFGRIDVRAKLPKGQGIWPAIWMLGENIDEVSWPACGEIDIMELVGHEPKTIHGTAHFGLRGEPSTFKTASKAQDTEFIEAFHVFSIVWEFNEITWYLDETKYHSFDSSQTQGKPYPFNNEFFFIFNVAVGGNWPGSPDETTLFPQQMEIDYVRVFQ